MAEVEPEWIDITTFENAAYVVQLDVRAEPGSKWEYRYQERRFTGNTIQQWHPGLPPRSAEQASTSE